MKQIVFATNNAHKLSEVRRIVGDKFDILSLADIGCHDESRVIGKAVVAIVLFHPSRLDEGVALKSVGSLGDVVMTSDV